MCIMLFLALIIFNKCFSCTFSVLTYLFCTSIMLSLLCLDVNKCSSFRFSTLKIFGKLFIRDYHPQTTAAFWGLPPPLLSAFFTPPKNNCKYKSLFWQDKQLYQSNSYFSPRSLSPCSWLALTAIVLKYIFKTASVPNPNWLIYERVACVLRHVLFLCVRFWQP